MSTILESKQIKTLNISYEALGLLDRSEALRTECLFFGKSGEELSLLTTNNFPKRYHTLLEAYIDKGYNVKSYFTDNDGFQEAIKRYDLRDKQKSTLFEEQQRKLHAQGQEAVKLLQQTFAQKDKYSEGDFLSEILRFAYQAGASDVHFQTEEQGVFMRLRKDGILQPLFMFSHEEFSKYLMKLKFLSGVKMNIVGHSQDGRFSIYVMKETTKIKIDIRASFLPNLRGDSIVLRFLDSSSGVATLGQLGMQPWHTALIERQLTKHTGLILVTGPTGSGKTTTVYSLLHQLNNDDRKIITLEDPVEYEIHGITQSQINEAAGYTFEEGLKGVLRHDPDIIMVGEIRSLASAELAVNAAITGHLVISTLHTNNAVEAVSRLLNMGVKPYMLTAALNCVIGQRLLRKAVHPAEIAPSKSLDTLLKDTMQRLEKVSLEGSGLYKNLIYSQKEAGGTASHDYEGRIGVFECLTITKEIKDAIIRGASSIDLSKILVKNNFLTMQDDALIKMLQKITTIEEIERVV